MQYLKTQTATQPWSMQFRKHKRKKGKLTCPPELRQLRKRCLTSIRDFQAEGEVTNTPDGNYVFRDNGASILAVAHLDVVQPAPRHFGHYKGQANVIYNTQLDDRLGAYTILDALPGMGIKVDVLLTEGEESCRSTAAYFQTEKSYNWLIEFDRAGTDIVMYKYETPELREILEAQGNEIGWGSYSDICTLEHLEVAGFNWGIGYHDNHFPDSHFKISEYKDAILRFRKFYNTYKDTKFEYVPNEWSLEDDKWWGRDQGAGLGEYAWESKIEREQRLEWEQMEAAQERVDLQRKIDFRDAYADYYP